MTPVESVAKAIYLDRNGAGGTPWGRLPNAHKAPYISDAKAAITTLAQCMTFEMVQAAKQAPQHDIAWAITCAIRAALKGEPHGD